MSINLRFAAAQTLMDRALVSERGITYDAGSPEKAYGLVQDINKFRKYIRGLEDVSEYDAFLVRRQFAVEGGKKVFSSVVEIVPREVPADDKIVEL